MRLLLFIAICISVSSAAQEQTLLIGTYTGSGSKGIYVYRFDAKTGAASWVSNTDTARNPSYLAVAPNGKFVYAVNETVAPDSGSVTAYAFDRTSGALTQLNVRPTGGDAPCYISIDNTNRWAITANYVGGNLSVFPLAKDGSIQPHVQVLQDTGSGANKDRQEAAHMHCALFSPDQRYIFSPDLGTDNVMIYRFDKAAKLPVRRAQPPAAQSQPGSGPRHFTFSPNQKFAYLVEELSGTVVAYKYNNGQLYFLQRISTHPKNYTGAKGSADIHLSPDGKFLYATNRGDANSIAVFSVAANGRLQLKGIQSTQGVHPRNFVIDPTGNFVLVANRDTDAVVIFKRSATTGLLRDTGKRISVPKPVCLVLVK